MIRYDGEGLTHNETLAILNVSDLNYHNWKYSMLDIISIYLKVYGVVEYAAVLSPSREVHNTILEGAECLNIT